jgi:heat shock protein HslJ
MKMRTTLLTLMLLCLAVVGIMAQEETETPSDLLITISPFESECVGEAPMACLVIRELPDGELSYFYDDIAGFEYEAGYEYLLRVSQTTVENPPADSSALSYELIEVMTKFPASLTDKVWELQSIGDTEVENPGDFTLIFNEDETLAITTDCNEIMISDYTTNPASITVAGMTRMLCEASLEGSFINALNTVHLWTIENGELIMTTDEGTLRFVPPSIEGKTWRVQSYTDGMNNWEDDGSADYTMQFNGDTVNLMIACNGGSGTVFHDGSALRLEEVISTLMGCASDPLAGHFPPMHFVYSVNPEGRLVLETTDSEKYILVEVSE